MLPVGAEKGADGRLREPGGATRSLTHILSSAHLAEQFCEVTAGATGLSGGKKALTKCFSLWDHRPLKVGETRGGPQPLISKDPDVPLPTASTHALGNKVQWDLGTAYSAKGQCVGVRLPGTHRLWCCGHLLCVSEPHTSHLQRGMTKKTQHR